MRLLVALGLAMLALCRPSLAPVGETPFARLTFDMIFGNLWTYALWIGAVTAGVNSVRSDKFWPWNWPRKTPPTLAQVKEREETEANWRRLKDAGAFGPDLNTRRRKRKALVRAWAIGVGAFVGLLLVLKVVLWLKA